MPHGKTVPSSTKMSFRCNPPHPPQHGQGDENKGYSVGPNGAYYVTAVNRQRFSPAEWRDMGLMLTLLREDMPTLLGSRDAVWPALCAAMARWEKAHSESLRVALDHERCTAHPPTTQETGLGCVSFSAIIEPPELEPQPATCAVYPPWEPSA